MTRALEAIAVITERYSTTEMHTSLIEGDPVATILILNDVLIIEQIFQIRPL